MSSKCIFFISSESTDNDFIYYFLYTIYRAKKRILRFDNQQQTSSTASGDSSPQSGPYKRVSGTGSNIHRLSDTRESDDENNTWNGNSTQQQ